MGWLVDTTESTGQCFVETGGNEAAAKRARISHEIIQVENELAGSLGLKNFLRWIHPSPRYSSSMFKLTRAFSTSVPRAVKISTVPASSDVVSTLKVYVKGAGSKDAPAGLSHLLASSAFLDTQSKSALKQKREVELLGAKYGAEVTRDALVLEASFLKENLPYFVELLGNTLAEPSFKDHQFAELVVPFASYQSTKAEADTAFKALEELHAISYRNGLGKPLYYDGSKVFTEEDVSSLAKAAFTDANVEIVGNNVVEEDLAKFVAASKLGSLPAGPSPAGEALPQESFTGVESRIRQAGKTVAVLGLPVGVADAASYKLVAAAVESVLPDDTVAEIDVKVTPYAESALLSVSVAADDASLVSEIITAAASELKAVSGKPLGSFKPLATYIAAADGLSTEDISSASESVTIPKFNLVVVGDVDTVPLIGEL